LAVVGATGNVVAFISNMWDTAGMSTVADDRRLARQGLKVLDHQPSLHDSDGHSVELSEAAAAGLRELLEAIADGDAPVVVRRASTLTTQQAADMLNVSRPHVVKLIDRGDIPSHKVGAHRRVALDDVLAYRDRWRAEQDRFLDEMTADAEALGLYDR
jgi:excisionase family DNA binding protein